MTTSAQVAIIARPALSPAQYQEIVALCSRAYEEAFADTLALFPDATHVLAYCDDVLVSHALWIPRTLHTNSRALRTAYVEAVATEPRYQRQGYAATVLRALADAIISYDLGVLSPSDPAFYARFGWETWLGPLAVATDTGITPTFDETVMILRLRATPPLDIHSTLVAPWREGEVW